MNIIGVSPINTGFMIKNKKQYNSKISKQSVKYNQSFSGSINFGNGALEADIAVFTKGITNDILPKFVNLTFIDAIKEYFSADK